MRTSTGGVAGDTNITEGFERIVQLFDCIKPQDSERTFPKLKVKFQTFKNPVDNGILVTIKYNDQHEATYTTRPNVVLRLKLVTLLNLVKKLLKVRTMLMNYCTKAGIEKVRHYIHWAVQKVLPFYKELKFLTNTLKHISQLTNKATITNPGDSQLFVGETININEFTR